MSNWTEASQAGRADAERDIQAGRLAIETIMTPFSCTPKYARILTEWHSVEFKIVDGYMLNDEIRGHRASYNAVMEEEVKRRFGSDILEKAAAEADAQAASN